MKRNFKKGISMLVALAMTLTSASVVFADGELVTSVKYKDGFVTVTGTTENANEAVDIFLLNPGETKVDLGGADTTAEYNETVNFSDVIYSDAAKDFEITFEISNQNDEAAYLLYVKAEDGEEYEKTISLNNIYVAANGSDETGNGSKEKPYATIQKAQTAARAASKDVATNVIIGEGTYAITSALTFTADDSGTAEAPVTYKAAEGAKVVVSGATQIPMDKISPLTDADSAIINRLPASVAKKVVKVDLSEVADAITDYASNWSAGSRIKPMGVYLNDDYQDISRWPNTGYTTIKANDIAGANNREPLEDAGKYAKVIIKDLDYSKISSWQNLDKVFIDGYLRYEWYVDSAKIASVTNGSLYDESNQYLGGKGTIDGAVIQLSSNKTAYGVADGGRVVLKNVLEEIDSPGEWYVDGKTMYYYPPHTLTEADTLEIATLQSDMVSVLGASNFAIEGITFEKNSNSNGFRINNGDNVTIKDCAMKDLGAWGINHSGTTNLTIDGCVMNNLGLGGITTSSGNNTELTSGNAVIKNCHISDIARDYQANSVAAVTVSGCGTTVKNNTFHNMKNSAIRYSGTKHLFKENEIFNAVNDTTDAGAIYSGRSYINYGTKIQNNYLYHIGGRSELQSGNPVAGIYWDDNQSGETAIGNIIVTNSTASGTMGIHIGGGADVVVTDNILVNVSEAEPEDNNDEAKRVGPYAVHANRDSKTAIEDGTYLSSEVFASYMGATNLTFNSNEKDENGNLKYDTNGDGILTSTEINAARGALLVANSGTENWKSAYLTEFDGKVRSMFELLIGKKFQKRNTYKDNFSYRAIDNIKGYMNPYHKTDGILGTGIGATVDGDTSITYAESVEVAKSGFAQTNDYDFRLKDAQGTAAITSATPLSTFGAKANGYEIAAEEKEFDLVFPAKKASVLGTSTYIKWEKVNVADEYNYVVSKNADLSSPIASGVTTDTMVEITGLDADTTYYWSVEAVNLSFNIGGSLGTKTSEFKTATYEFTSPAYDATTQNVTVDYVNAGTAAIEDVNFIAAVKVGGKLMSSAVSVQDVVVSNDGTITIPASTLTNLADEGATLELYIWNKDMTALRGKMLVAIK